MSLLKVIKTVINEYNNYDYPAGADADPSAPWNQTNSPEFDAFDIVYDGDNLADFIVKLHDTANGTDEVSIEKMLITTKSNEDEYLYFDWALEQNPKPATFMKKLNNLCEKYSSYAEYTYPENDDYDPNDY